MEDFFHNNEKLQHLAEFFTAACVKDEEFFSLKLEQITEILKGDSDAAALFLPIYTSEKSKNRPVSNGSHPDLNMSWQDIVLGVINNDEIPDNSYELIAGGTEDDSSRLNTKDTEGGSRHNIPDDFDFIKNSLYFSLLATIEGRVILGMYKNSNILLETRLKYLIIQKLIVENPITYRITRDRFLEETALLKELFPTIRVQDWYCASRSNSHGQEVSASGCLINYYKIYRKNLAKAGIITFGTDRTVNVPADADATHSNTSRAIDLNPLTNQNRSSYDISTILNTWNQSFDRRLNSLVQFKNKKPVIKYNSYLNTFICLNSTFGLELLETDSYRIIQKLADDKSISQAIADDFRTIFQLRWPVIAELVCKQGDASGIACIKEFKHKYGTIIDQIPHSIKALFYVALALSKSVTVNTQQEGKFTFSREECVNHFIVLLEEESEVNAYKLKRKTIFESLRLTISPYVIFCGELNLVNKTFVVVDDIQYDGKEPLQAVETQIAK